MNKEDYFEEENNNDKWILMSEKLPEDGMEILISLSTLPWVVYGRYTQEYGVLGRRGVVTYTSSGLQFEDLKNVLAWKPLPKPYELK